MELWPGWPLWKTTFVWPAGTSPYSHSSFKSDIKLARPKLHQFISPGCRTSSTSGRRGIIWGSTDKRPSFPGSVCLHTCTYTHTHTQHSCCSCGGPVKLLPSGSALWSRNHKLPQSLSCRMDSCLPLKVFEGAHLAPTHLSPSHIFTCGCCSFICLGSQPNRGTKWLHRI